MSGKNCLTTKFLLIGLPLHRLGNEQGRGGSVKAAEGAALRAKRSEEP